uniref:Reverse transcriptase domain-containing protein n=1 Tax=Timema poppense TaxID=170557 RepID=A0A7R9H450_TIMPO|nr:unnamed protein product [Timema poppensis]
MPVLLYADDSVLMAESERDLQKELHRLNVVTDRMDLRINISTTKVMVFDKDGSRNVCIKEKSLEQVNDLVYLGGMFCNNGRKDGEIDRLLDATLEVVGWMWTIAKNEVERIAFGYSLKGFYTFKAPLYITFADGILLEAGHTVRGYSVTSSVFTIKKLADSKDSGNTSDAQESKKYIKARDSFIETKRISAQKDYLKAKFTTEDSRSLTKERFRLREEYFDDYPTKYNPEPISLNETGQTNLDMFTSTVNDTFKNVKTDDANSKTSEMFRFSEASLDDHLTQNITGQDFFSENEKSRRDVPVSTPLETVSLDNTTTLGDSAEKYFSNSGSNENGFMPKRMLNLSSSLYLKSAFRNMFLGSPREIKMGYMFKSPYQNEDIEREFPKEKLPSYDSKIHFANKNINVSKENEIIALKHGILGLLREQQGDDVLNKYSDTFGHEAFLGGLFPMRMMPETTNLK